MWYIKKGFNHCQGNIISGLENKQWILVDSHNVWNVSHRMEDTSVESCDKSVGNKALDSSFEILDIQKADRKLLFNMTPEAQSA